MYRRFQDDVRVKISTASSCPTFSAEGCPQRPDVLSIQLVSSSNVPHVERGADVCPGASSKKKPPLRTMSSTRVNPNHTQVTSRLCTLPGELRNVIYGYWTFRSLELSHQRTQRQVTDVGFLGCCRLICCEASDLYYSTKEFEFANLDLLRRFLASRSVSQRATIQRIKIVYDNTDFAFDAFDLLLSCTILKALRVEVRTAQRLTLASPGMGLLRQMRGLRSLTFPGWRYAVDPQCRRVLRKEMCRKTRRGISVTAQARWYRILQKKHSRIRWEEERESPPPVDVKY